MKRRLEVTASVGDYPGKLDPSSIYYTFGTVEPQATINLLRARSLR